MIHMKEPGTGHCAATTPEGRRCLLHAHGEETPHCCVGRGGWQYWGGKCKLCGKPAEDAKDQPCVGDAVH